MGSMDANPMTEKCPRCGNIDEIYDLGPYGAPYGSQSPPGTYRWFCDKCKFAFEFRETVK